MAVDGSGKGVPVPPVPPTRITSVVSTNRNGGVSETFELIGNSNNNNNNNNNDKDSNGSVSSTMVMSQTKNQRKSASGLRLSVKAIVAQTNGALRSTFLPSGFPATTPKGYLSYSAWSWIQDLSTQLRGVLATQKVLEGVGVGKEGATALSALMNFLVRDGCGMAATLLFTSVASSRFGSDVKRWRLFADLMVDIGITLEVAATLVPPNLFLPMICESDRFVAVVLVGRVWVDMDMDRNKDMDMAMNGNASRMTLTTITSALNSFLFLAAVGNMCKAICGVAAGACGGAINLHWAKGSDISDIQAKFGAQVSEHGITTEWQSWPLLMRHCLLHCSLCLQFQSILILVPYSSTPAPTHQSRLGVVALGASPLLFFFFPLAHCDGKSRSDLCCVLCTICVGSKSQKLVDIVFIIDSAPYLCQYEVYAAH